jgi:Ca2+-binding RTX toxin-like protein
VQGRAVYREVDASSTFTIRGSILSEDGANECVGAAAIGSGGHNIDRGTSCAFAGTGDQSSTDPGLLPLADNGGPTETRAIPDGSAAENVVPAADCDDAAGNPLLADQRGFPRPFPAGGSCDGGAYELNRTCLGRGVTTLAGSSSADSILGTSGDDVLAAGAGNDTIAPGAGNDRVCGEAGTDTASFAGGAKVTVNLATGTASGQGTDLLSTIENLTGSSLADTLLGNSLANLIRAGKGADTARGGGGNDTLLGEAGNDRLFGQAGRDHLTGGKGRRDRCNGGGGRDRRRAKGCEVRRRIP